MHEPNRKTTVLVADDEEFFALGVKTGLEAIPTANLRVDIVYQVIEQVFDKIRESSFDVLILDLDWHDEQNAGLEAIPRIKDIKPNLPIIVISGYPKLVTQARKQGVEIARVLQNSHNIL